MKNIITILSLLTLISNEVISQNPIWSLPNNYIVSLNYAQSLPALLGSYGANHNAYPAPDGSWGFYVVDEYVYDGNGALIGAMWLPTAVELL